MQGRQIERIVGGNPWREERADQTNREHDRRSDRDRRSAETVGEIAVPRDGERTARAKRNFDVGRRRGGGHVVHCRGSAIPCSACNTAARACPYTIAFQSSAS